MSAHPFPTDPLPLGPGVTVVGRHPAGLLALAKPGGVRSHPNAQDPDPRALLTVAYDPKLEAYSWTGDAGTPQRLHLLHRLDAPTSGVVILASDPALAKAVRQAFASRAVQKTYQAVVFGSGARSTGTWSDRLASERRAGRVRTRQTSPAGSGASAVTSVHCLRSARGPFRVSLLSLRPKTGRTHQLRVQCASRHLPIVGDATYGDFARNRDLARATGQRGLFLHAAAIELRIHWRGRDLHFCASAPTPPAFDAICPPP